MAAAMSQRIVQTVDARAPVLGKLARSAWVEWTNVRRRMNGREVAVDSRGTKVIADLQRDGTSVVPRFFDAARCAQLRDAIDGLLDEHANRVVRDALDSDKRLFGAERVSDAIAEVYNDPFIRGTVDGYERSQRVEGCAMVARMDFREGNLGSGLGWHRDNALRTHTKAIAYLSDVGPDNGPFEYLPRSHRAGRIVYDMVSCGFEHAQMRFSDEEIARLENSWPGYERARFPAPEGSLVFADTRGLHRGSPIEAGVRYAVTLYLWFDQPMPGHVERLLVDA